ncbi:pyridoxamine 5'-phosphate oxidase family protein [Bifidobacterium magnum]|uniref:Pyridoxamine 5'-phosphate oxidase n=1 Tax=Bifidobacterium magnum TaxID=1692 RepID=A0A087B6D4_9BIFI|nr:pyridoxamine 5'-phosphate oxidase family protein [Bifidobacterium magnum]KFI66584.1 Pyridoxamine 5'-phosphate oxidase [Bifidobacterium magnum]
MAVLTQDMQEFVDANLCWVATQSLDGVLGLGPKMSMYVLDETHLAYHERTAGQTYRNLEDGSPLVVACANLAEKTGYRFRGNVTLHTDDELYKEQVAVAEANGTKVPACIVVLEVTAIEDLTGGAKAGTTIAKD